VEPAFQQIRFPSRRSRIQRLRSFFRSSCVDRVIARSSRGTADARI